jgi:hypothetical protein
MGTDQVRRLQLSSDFDAVEYLDLNPDVAAARIDPEFHFIQHV